MCKKGLSMTETKLGENKKKAGVLKIVLIAILSLALLCVGAVTVNSYSKTVDIRFSVMSTDDGNYYNATQGGRVMVNTQRMGLNLTETVRHGQKISLQAQANEGYSFAGYYSTLNSEEPLSMDADYSFIATNDVSTIYASFAKNYDIEFSIGNPLDPNGEEITFTETFYVGQKVTISDIIANNESLGSGLASYFEASIPELSGESGVDSGFSFSKNTIVVGSKDIQVKVQPTEPALVGLSQDSSGRYTIATSADLLSVASYINSGNATYLSASYIVTGNITVASHTPIGNANNAFKGIFDGNNKTITITAIASTSASYVGLFGYNAGTIKNIAVAGGTVQGASYVGGIAGYNTGTIINATVSAPVKGSGSYVGGIVGVNSGKLKDVHSTGAISGTNTTFGLAIGGVVGINLSSGIIHNAISTGAVAGSKHQWVGGLIGQNHGTIQNAFAQGAVTGVYYVGGVAGQNGGGTIRNVYSRSAITGTDYKGGVCGYQKGGTIQYTYYLSSSATIGIGGTSSNTSGVVDSFTATTRTSHSTRDDITIAVAGTVTVTINGTTVYSLLDALNYGQNQLNSTQQGEFYVWGANSANAYPTIKYTAWGTGSGTSWAGFGGDDGSSAAKAYLIENERHLKNFYTNVNGGTTYSNKFFKLAANIAISSSTWRAAGSSSRTFAGNFNGQGFTISNMNITTASNGSNGTYMGMFGYNTGTVQNLHITGSMSGTSYVGGVVGYNTGTIENVTFTGTITATGSYIGGVVGVNNGTVHGCSHKGNVTASNPTFGLAVGGIAGINLSTKTIKNCYSDGLSGTSISYTVGGSKYQWVGGIVGQNHGYVYNSYNNKKVTGSYYVGGAAGQNGGGTIQNIYHRGALTATGNSGSTTGYNKSGSISAHYYISNTGSGGTNGTDGKDGSTLLTSLNSWGSIGSHIKWVTGVDGYPALSLYGKTTITINPSGGVYNGNTANVTASGVKGTTYGLGVPTRAGYNFAGWAATNSNNLSNSTGISMPGTLSSWGVALYDNADFATGNPTSWGNYCWNGANSDDAASTTHTRITDTTNPLGSGYSMQIQTTGSGSTSRPGFVHTINSQSNNVFYQVTVAKIPVGYYFYHANNSMGSGATHHWWDFQTQTWRTGTGSWNYGTGDWQVYIYRVVCGATGSFSTGGHKYVRPISSSTALATTWYVGYSQVYQVYAGTGSDIVSGRGDQPTSYMFGSKDTTLKALWSPKQVTISVDPNGGTFANSESVTNYTQTIGTSKSIADPYRAGYEFLGWIPTATKTTFSNQAGTTTSTDTWAQVFFHHNKGGTVLFSTSDNLSTTTINAANKFSMLNQLNLVKTSSSGWEFLLEYPAVQGKYNRWIQSANPTTTSEGSATTTSNQIYAAGYQAVHIDWTSNYWGGLGRSSTTSTYIDGSYGHSNWYYAIGATAKYGVGIPSANDASGGSIYGVTSLWVKLPVSNVQDLGITTSFKNADALGSNNTYYFTDQNVTLQAVWKPLNYNVTLDSDGGTVENANGWSFSEGTAQKTITFNTEYNLPTLSKYGYEHTGWELDAVYTGGTFDGNDYVALGREYMYTDSLYVKITASMTDWTQYSNMRMLSCTEGGGWNFIAINGNMGCDIYDAGVGYKSFASTRTLASLGSGQHVFEFTFDGEYGRIYIDGDLCGTSAQITSGRIGYNANNGIFIGAEAGGNTGTPAGPYFTGTISEVVIRSEENVKQEVANLVQIPSNHRLIAQWTPATYDITLNGNGANFLSQSTVQAQYETTTGFDVEKPTRIGHNFIGWWTADEGGAQVADIDGNFLTNVAGFTDGQGRWVHEEARLYAQWEEITYTLTIDANGGAYTGETSVTQNYGTTLEIANPTLQGHTFAGWLPTKTVTTKNTADGSTTSTDTWVQVFYHNNVGGTDLFTAEDGLANNPIALLNKFSLLSKLEVLRTGGAGGSWEFMLEFSSQSGKYNRWIQSSNPTTTPEGETQTTAPGYSALYLDFSASYWGGLGLSNTENTFIDGSYGHADWYYAIGAFSPYLGGVPADSAAEHGVTTLWVKVPSSGINDFPIISEFADFDALTADNKYHFRAQNITLTAMWVPLSYTISYNGNGETSGAMDATNHTYGTAAQIADNQFGKTFAVGFESHGDSACESLVAQGQFLGWHSNVSGGQFGTTDALGNTITTESLIPNLAYVLNVVESPAEVIFTAQWQAGSITLPTPTRAGFEFLGWYTAETGGTFVGKDGDEYTPTAAITLHAVWQELNFTITLEPNGGTGGTTSVLATFGITQDFDITNPTRTGYDFAGWWTQKSGGSQVITDAGVLLVGVSGYTNANGKWARAEDTPLYAHWTAKTYTVTLNPNGGEVDPTTITVTYDSNYGTLPEATRDGYKFSGWWTDRENGTEILSTSVVQITDVQTLYAHWTANTYTVTFNPNGEGATCSTINKLVTFAAEYGTLPDATRTGFTFAGWWTEPENGVQITQTTIVESAQDHMLYAHWTVNIATVTVLLDGSQWVGNGKTVALYEQATQKYSQIITSGASAVFQNVPNGITYSVYATASSLNGAVLVNTGITLQVDANGSGTAEVNYFTLTLEKTTGIASVSGGGIYLSGQAASISATAEPAYEFANWTATGSAPQDLNAAQTTVVVTQATTLTANAEAQKYTITFEPNGGTGGALSANEYTFSPNAETIITVSSEPSRNGYSVQSYSTSGAQGQTPSVQTSTITLPAGTFGNITITTNWQAITYTITYEPDGGTLNQTTQEYTIETDLTLFAAPEKPGHTFTGWKVTTASGNWTSGNTFTEGANVGADNYGNITLTAQWQINEYTLTVNFIDLQATTQTTITAVATGAVVSGAANKGSAITVKHSYLTSSIEVVISAASQNYYISIATPCTEQSSLGSISHLWTPTGKASIDVFVAEKYTITYASNQETSGTLPQPQNKVHGLDATLAINTLTRDGYTPNGWNMDAQISETPAFASGANYSQNESITLYPNWQANAVTIYIQKDDGTAWANSGMHVALINASNNFEATVTTGISATFTVVPVGQYSIYASYSTLQPAEIRDTGIDIEIVKDQAEASGTVSYFTLLLTFNADQGITATSGSGVYLSGQTVSISATVGNGYSFEQWLVVENHGSQSDVASSKEAQTTVFMQQATTILATATENPYVITYNLDGGTILPNITTQEYTVEEDLTLFAAPEKSGHTFAGWKVTNKSGNWAENSVFAAKENIGTGKYGNITLSAQWTANEYTITLNPSGGTGGTTSVKAVYGETSMFSITNPTRTGYTFNGWWTLTAGGSLLINTTGQLQTVNSYSPNGVYAYAYDLTLYAQWTANDLIFNNQTLVSGKYLTAYESAFTGATGGTGNYTYTITAFTVDDETLTSVNNEYEGLKLSHVTFSGKPTKSGTYVFVVLAEDSETHKQKSAQITIFVNKLEITGTATISGDVVYGAELSAVITNTLENPTYTYKWLFKAQGQNTFTELAVNSKAISITADICGVDTVVGGTFQVVVQGSGHFTGEVTSAISTPVSAKTIGWANNPIVANKFYDATTHGTISTHGTITGVISGDVDLVTLVNSNATAVFENAHANEDVPTNVIITGYSLADVRAGNYSLTQPSGVTATIFKAEVTVTPNGAFATSFEGTKQYVTKIYDQTITATLTNQHYVVSSNGADAIVKVTSANYASANVGLWDISAEFELADTANFKFTNGGNQITLNGQITKATPTITLSSSALSIVYGLTAQTTFTYTGDGVVSATSSASTVATASITNNTITVTSHNVGSATITISAADGNNFSTAQSKTIDVIVTPSVVTVSPIGAYASNFEGEKLYIEKVYDGTNSAKLTSGTHYSLTASGAQPEFDVDAAYASSQVGKWEITATFILADTTNFQFAVSGNQITLNGEITILQISVTFHGNGGSVSPESITATHGQPYGTLATATRTGYDFDGWFTQETNGEKITSQTVVESMTSHILYAHWTPKTFVVTLNANGGTITPETVEVTFDENYPLLANAARDGYEFFGWWTAADGGSQITTNTKVTIAQNHTLYAHWSANEYTITVNFNGGIGGPVSATSYSTNAQADAVITLSQTTPSRTGHTFNGWQVSGENGEVTFQNDNKQAVIKKGTFGNLTFTAQWTANDYTLTIIKDHGVLTVSGNTTYHYNDPVTLKVTSLKTFYAFTEWIVQSGTVSGVNLKQQEISFTMPAENIVIKAVAHIMSPIEMIVNIIDNTFASIQHYYGDLEHLVIPEYVSYNKNTGEAVKGNEFMVTEIAANAFNGKSTLKSVVIPETVTKIGTLAFENCDNLKTIEIRSTTLTIEKYAFGTNVDDAALDKTLYINSPNVLENVVKSALYENSNAGLSSHGNILVGVGQLYISANIMDLVNSQIVTLSDFLTTSYVLEGGKVNKNDIDYYLHRRSRTNTKALASRIRREDEDIDPLEELEIYY